MLAELDLTPAISGMELPAAVPWVSVAAVGAMLSIEGSADEVDVGRWS